MYVVNIICGKYVSAFAILKSILRHFQKLKWIYPIFLDKFKDWQKKGDSDLAQLLMLHQSSSCRHLLTLSLSFSLSPLSLLNIVAGAQVLHLFDSYITLARMEVTGKQSTVVLFHHVFVPDGDTRLA